jgi:hypothetical protein
LEEAADVVSDLAPGVVGARRKVPVAVEFPAKTLASNRFSGDRFTQWSSVNRIELPFPSRTVEWLITTRPCTALKVRAASASLPTLFPSSTGSRLSPSSSRGAIHDMAQTGRSNVRYVDPQRRYTVVLGPSWNAPFEALPHNDRAGTHDSADRRCGSYAPIGCGQAALWITSKNFCRSASPLRIRHERRGYDGASRAHSLTVRC